MCLSKPAIPEPAPPPQEQKTPDSMNTRRKQTRTPGGGTLLTGPAGVATGALNTGGSTLLGG
jgi:hypothetical protein